MTCGEYTKSKDEDHAQLIQQNEPNSTLGAIMSVLAFEFEGLYGLDTSVPITKDSN